MAKTPDQDKTARELLYEREKRVMEAIRLQIPDRVPVVCPLGYFPAKYAGIPCTAAYYDFDAWYNAYAKTLRDFQADFVFTQNYTCGKYLEELDPKLLLWPGHGADPNHTHQSRETEAMQGDEYDAFIQDPSDYIFRIHLSRVSDKLAGMADLPKLSELAGPMAGAQELALAFSSPKTRKALNTLVKAGQALRKELKNMRKFDDLLRSFGYGHYIIGAAMPPYDVLSHSMRGMRGTMLDMYRQPDKVLEICEKIAAMTMARPLPPANEFGNIRIFMTNTRGSDDFLSKKHFDKFYWPTFKKVVQNLIDRGAVPSIFFEGSFTSHLEYLLDFPKGSILVRLDTTDIFRAKEVLGDHLCLEGNVPSTLLQVGTVQDVEDYCKKLIDVVGKNGGFILGPRSSTDEVKPANLKAMIDFTREYGVYR